MWLSLRSLSLDIYKAIYNYDQKLISPYESMFVDILQNFAQIWPKNWSYAVND